MATVNGYLPEPRVGITRAPLSASINNDWYLYRGAPRLFAPRVAVDGLITRGTPAEVTRYHRGYITFNLIDRLYNRIIVSPLVINVGNIAADVKIDLSVFNAYFTTQTLTNITVNTSAGIELTGPAVPLVFNRLTIKYWLITVLADGDPEINYQITLQFLGLPAVTVQITGRRAVPWLYGPTWSERFTESLEWLTDVMTSQTGAEQRRARRLSPRRTFEFSVALTQSERRQFENMLYRFAARTWALPVYPDRQTLQTAVTAGQLTIPMLTSGYDVQPGGLMMLQDQNRSEMVKIDLVYDDRLTITQPTVNAWPAGAAIYPVRTAQLAEIPKITRITDDTIKAAVKFTINEHNAYSRDYPFVLYRGYPVLTIKSSWHDDLTTEYQRLIERIDNDTGLITIKDMAGRAFTVQEYHFVIYQRAEHDAFRRLLYSLRGRLKPLWIISQNSDVIAMSNITGTTLEIDGEDYTIEPGRRDICIELNDGSRIYRRIETVTTDNGRQRLGLDGDPFNVSLNTILKISFMTLARLNDDDVELEHVTDGDGLATITVNFRSVRDELE